MAETAAVSDCLDDSDYPSVPSNRPVLKENDVAGASLNGKSPVQLKIPELKRWLQCRDASTKGKKSDLVRRVQAYIANEWSDNLVDPEKKTVVSSNISLLDPAEDVGIREWKPIKDTFPWVSDSALSRFTFSNAEIITYFVTRTTVDGLPSCDMKSMNTSALNLFRCGHIQDIHVCYAQPQNQLNIRSNCIPEMRKDRQYKLFLILDSFTGGNIVGAECGCPAGKAPHASCKHIGALCYALEEYSRLGRIDRDYLTCTDRLQEWNKPRQKRLDPLPVTSLSSRRNEILQNNKNSSLVLFDPRPLGNRKLGNEAIEKLRCDLLSLDQSPAFLDVLVPSVDKIDHDHKFYSKSQNNLLEDTNSFNHKPAESILSTDLPSFTLDRQLIVKCALTKLKSNVSLEERKRIELITRKQSVQPEWYLVRSKRITGSKCGKILIQKKRSVSLLRECLYPKPLVNPPKPIAWGRHYESIAIKKYSSLMKKVHPNIVVKECGFIIHPNKGWLGASPDGRVYDVDATNGILEVKCPYSMRELSPEDACSHSKFYCELHHSKVRLKQTHAYFHQVQLQLYVGADLYDWCDFCVYTCKGMSIERIYPDVKWQQDCIPQLESFYDDYMLPEIILEKYKPRYYL